MKIQNLFFIAFQNFKIHYINSLFGFLWLPLSFLILIFAKSYLFIYSVELLSFHLYNI